MSLSREDFIRKLDESGVINLGDLLKVEEDAPTLCSSSADELAEQLIADYRITDYQARVILQEVDGPLKVGDYHILEQIGEGGMGVVFKARAANGRDLVALKLLPPRLSEKHDAKMRFEREVTLASRLMHPNIVTAIGSGEEDGKLFFVMEFVDGLSLSEILKEGSPLPLLTAFECIRDATRGISYAHQNNVIHRDVKPSNLLMRRDGFVKVLDMGLARCIDEEDPHELEQTRTQITHSGAILGTADFMAPEQAINSKNAGPHADIYSLGCTLYYALTGKHMFEGSTIMEKIIAHRERPIPALSDARGDVPKPVESIYQRMVAKRPKDRFESAAKLLKEMEDCLSEFGHMWMIKRYLAERKGRHNIRGEVV